MSKDNNTFRLVQKLHATINEFMEQHPEAQLGDILSASTWLLVTRCRMYGIKEEEVLRNIRDAYPKEQK
jgi:hypothetical protein